ncbi:hypothetical protein GCM10007199_39300 [Fictibacillus barbaricus]|nr:hypothetical protein GCM10007199_39300 [Fictibacillus barbaricus]
MKIKLFFLRIWECLSSDLRYRTDRYSSGLWEYFNRKGYKECQ